LGIHAIIQKMNKAFIFDMDGVIVNSEQIWKLFENDFLDRILGKEIAKNIGDTVGTNVEFIYEKACALGLQMSKRVFREFYDTTAYKVYARATITPDLDKLVAFLLDHHFKLGLVSASPQNWIDQVLPRLSFTKDIECILSLDARPDLSPKPSPDGYLETMKCLGSDPAHTIILEDSNAGIESGLNSKAYTIAFTYNLIEGYTQIKADAVADTIDEVIKIVHKRFDT